MKYTVNGLEWEPQSGVEAEVTHLPDRLLVRTKDGEVACKQGDTVEVGQRLIVLEAMKMQQPVNAPVGGKVKEVFVVVGSQVAEGEVLAVVEEAAE
jgi:biotin carboxyl carrier protein